MEVSMKKVLAIILSAALLITALAVNVVAATEPVTQTVSATFKAYSTGNQYDTLKPVEVGSGIQFRTSEPGVGHIDITGLIEQVTDLENVTSISVTFEAVGKEAFASREDGGNAIIGLKGVYNDATNYDIAPINWGTNQTPYTMSGNLLDGTAAVYIDTSSHGAIPQEEPWEFKVTVAVTYTPQGKVRIGDEYFDTLVEAVDAAQSGDTIYLLDNLEGAGIGIFAADGDVKDFTIDFGGFTYTCEGPAVGSSGTQSQAFHLEKSADYTPNVTFKNGTITAETGKNVKMLIQNYCNLTLTDMNLIGTTDTQYVLSNNFGNTVIDGNTSITATAGNVAFDVCYANGSYKDGVSVTVNTTGTITGIIELGTWNAAGAATGAPDINDYLENANLIINNVKLDGEIRNVVTGTYEPDPEVYSSPAGLELFISTMSDINAPSVATVTNENGDSTEIAGPGKYKVTYTPTTEITSYDWIMIKSAGSTGQSVAASSIPQGTTIRTTSLKINGSTISFPNDAESVDYTVGTNGQVELKYYFSLNWGGEIFTTKPSETISSIEIEFEIVENEKSEEEIAAELKDKLTETVAINGGVFGAGSGVEDYLPEGDYETDDDGNIVIGDVVDDEVDYSHIKLTGGCVYLNENYHAFIVNGRFLAGHHIDNGSGFCPLCRAEINTTPAE